MPDAPHVPPAVVPFQVADDGDQPAEAKIGWTLKVTDVAPWTDVHDSTYMPNEAE
jgi:hypothetical protein